MSNTEFPSEAAPAVMSEAAPEAASECKSTSRSGSRSARASSRRTRQPKVPNPVVIPLAPVREGAELAEEYLRTFTTEEIGVLPLTAFVGKIIFVECDRQLHQAMKVLLGEELLGFDTETRPIFRKGAIPPPALLQLCGHKNVYIFQLAKLNDKAVLAELLAARHIIKSGVSVRDDLKGLREHFEFTEHGFVDLGDVAKKMNMLTHGLRNLTANLMGLRISKGAQCSNWAREALSTKQIVYAATDAWISRELYLRFVDLGVL
ncbi:MAG: 3'-5' exonuclease [Humidesulfovibrio sp.]|nr:3'-5' exonuclease [Humidesulfovibrio sp.]